MAFYHKTFYLPANPKAEYQKHGKVWVKRLKGAKTDFYPVDDNGQVVLQNTFKGGMLYYISDTAKIGTLAIVGITAYFLFFRKFGASASKPLANKTAIKNAPIK